MPASPAQGGASLYAVDGGRKYLNAGERRRVFEAAARLEIRKALLVLMLGYTGARVSEVLALTAGSFQPDRGIVAFATLKRRRHAVREVPIPPALMRELAAVFGLEEARRDPARAGERLWPWRRETVWRILKDAMAEAGLTGRLACPRALRHGFGVSTLQSGVPLNLVQRWLGHARMSTTAIYADASGPEELAFAARFWRAGRPCPVPSARE